MAQRGQPMTRKEQAAHTETALKEAAKRRFAEQGYLSTKITDITAEAGRAAGSFYNHFASKEELLTALLADISAAGDARANTSAHSADFSDPGAIRWHIAAYVRFYRDNATTMRALRQAALVNADFARTLHEFGANEQADIIDHLAYITGKGWRLPGAPSTSIALLHALLDGFAWMWFVGDDQASSNLSEDQAIDALTTFVYRGLTGQDV